MKVFTPVEIKAEIARYSQVVAERINLSTGSNLFMLATEVAVQNAVRDLKAKGVRRVGWISSVFKLNVFIGAAMHHGLDQIYYINNERGKMPLFIPGQGHAHAVTVSDIESLDLDAIVCIHEYTRSATEDAFDTIKGSLDCPIVEIDMGEEYETLSAEQAKDTARQINELDVDVIYLAEFAYFNLCRQSQALRDKGMRTAILVQHPQSMEGKDLWFDGVFCAYRSPTTFFNIVHNLTVPVIHVQGWLTLHHLPVLIRAANQKAKLVLEFNDIPTLIGGEGDFLDLAFGKEVAEMERLCEPLVHKITDGLVFNVDKKCANALSKQYGTVGESTVFHCYPTKALCYDKMDYLPPKQRDDDRINLLFIGSLPPNSHARELYGDVQLLPMIRELVATNRFTFEIMLPPTHYRENPGYGDYRYFDDQNKGFKIHNGVYPEKLSEAIAGYDYGVMFYQMPEYLCVGKPHFDYMMPSKVYSFLEACLPIILSEEFKYVGSIIKEYGLGLTVSQDDIKNLDEVLAQHDPMVFRENIRKYRQTIFMDDKIKEMIGFYGKMFGNKPWTSRITE